jgi:mannose-6-phosphate isomerase-like protein (cupin superfamily)
MFRHEDEVPWLEPPGHYGAFSRYLVGPDHDSRQFDFRTSRYPTGGYVEEHAHDIEEQVYYILSGKGIMRCGDETREVGPGSVIFVPPRVVHGIRNEAAEDLTFVIVTSPPGIPR